MDLPFYMNHDVYELYLAAQAGNFSQAKRQLEKKINPNFCDDKGNTPLMLACRSGNLKLVKLLIQYAADVNSQNKQGETALYHACENRFTNVVKFLLKQKANPNIVSYFGTSPLLISCYKEGNNSSIVKALLRRNADANLKDLSGATPLMIASWRKNLKAVKLLLAEKNIALDTIYPDGEDTALTRTSAFNDSKHFQIAKLLVKAGADTTIRNAYGKSAFDYNRKLNALFGKKIVPKQATCWHLKYSLFNSCSANKNPMEPTNIKITTALHNKKPHN